MIKTLTAIFACGAVMLGAAQSARADNLWGCTSFALDTCYVVKMGKKRVALTADPGVAIPAPGTFIVARGKYFKPELDVCGGAALAFRASRIIATKRLCR